MAGLAIPAVGATGQMAKGGVGVFNDLPSEFTVSPLAQQSRILNADGKVKMHYSRYALDDINTAIDDFKNRRFTGRGVIVP